VARLPVALEFSQYPQGPFSEDLLTLPSPPKPGERAERRGLLPSSGAIDYSLGIRMEDPEPIEIPIDGILDLHTFQPREVKDLLPDYLAACRERGILQVRVIHGKGTGALRRTVHSILQRIPEVISFRLAGADEGGWGATLVELRPGEKLSRGQNS
jgi:hypothetical protein